MPLSAAAYEEAVSLLAELLLDAAARKAGVVSGGATGSVCAGVFGSVIPFPAKGGKARDAA